jgi:2-polyprenyl-6-methoxyphenol hydroxylase-like FAD-dependent oxidoreductase
MQVRRSLVEAPLAEVPTGGEGFEEVSPCEGIAISQDVFEAVLRNHVVRRPQVTLALGHELTSLMVTEQGGVTATVLDHSSGREQRWHPRYLLGADGVRSAVRRLLGVTFDGDPDLGRLRSVRFRADLSVWLGRPPPAFLRFVTGNAVLMATHADDRWVLIVPSEEGSGDAADLIARCLGVHLTFDVLGDHTWAAGVQTAVTMRRGPVFLLGDAAHRVTPAGATGITSALADANNVAWKLAAVLHGWAPESLLDSYEEERLPVARALAAVNRAMWAEARSGAPPAARDLRVLDMGYTYASHIVGTVPADQVTLPERHVQRAVPGSRAPHAWIDRHSDTSTIDLFPGTFTLLTQRSGSSWMAALQAAAAARGIPMRVYVTDDPAINAAYSLRADDAALVRPDGHVCWRTEPAQGRPRPDVLLDRVTGAE